ncbi:MAG TPA: 6-phosphogluconolactonase [Candidatus Cryosericum sp.]|nr:6-phosphogluconolactonase [Candidatus Cryosericum sp.]
MHIAPSRQAFADAGAAEFARRAREAVEGHGRFCVALAGGATPRSVYARVADRQSPYRAQIHWARTWVLFGDERQVAPDHDESNFRMASETLLRHVPVPEEQVHRIRGENPDSQRAAEEYEEILRDVFRLGAGEWPRFDLVLLGLGADGHTASLFPGSPAARETARLVTEVRRNPGPDRITLTLPVLNNAAAVLFLVSGASKAEAARQVLGGGSDLPAALVRPERGDLLWLLDGDAAAALPR